MRYGSRAFGQAIEEAERAKGIPRSQLADRPNIALRYIASIENSGRHPSLQIFYELVTSLDIPANRSFFPVKTPDKATQRQQFDEPLNGVDKTDLVTVTDTVKGIQKTKEAEETKEAGE